MRTKYNIAILDPNNEAFRHLQTNLARISSIRTVLYTKLAGTFTSFIMANRTTDLWPDAIFVAADLGVDSSVGGIAVDGALILRRVSKMEIPKEQIRVFVRVASLSNTEELEELQSAIPAHALTFYEYPSVTGGVVPIV